jgi:D-inositol-3-phosphate glycosyltransferase
MYQTSYTKGQELVAERMTRELIAQGHEAFLITSSYEDSEPTISEENIEKHGGYVHLYSEELGIPIIRVKSTIASWPPRRVTFVDFMAVLTDLVDELKLNVLISHSTLWNGPEEVLKFVEWRRSLAKDGRSHEQVAFCHMSHFQEPDSDRYEMVERSYRETWNKVSLAQIAKTADLILVTTPLEKDQMMALGAPEERCFLFPGGIEDTTEMSIPRFDQLDSIGGNGSKKLITTLGTVEERKNILTILEVAKRLSSRNDFQFVIAGRLEGEYGQKCAEVASSMHNVSLLGEVTDEMKLGLIRHSFLELTMSRAEALGLTQLEFLLEGVPVISAGSGGQPWIVKDGANGLILEGPDDVVGAANAIVRIADDPALYRRTSSMARRSAKPFTMPRLINKLSARLEDIVLGFSPRSNLLRNAPPDEKALEAMTINNQEVIATNRRLIVNTRNAKPVSIPYERITRITKYAEFPWPALIIGLALSGFLLAMMWLQQPTIERIPLAVQAFLRPYLAIPLFAISIDVALVPTLVVLIGTALSVKRGYLVYQSGSRPIFVPQRFLKVLRVIGRLIPQASMD